VRLIGAVEIGRIVGRVPHGRTLCGGEQGGLLAAAVIVDGLHDGGHGNRRSGTVSVAARSLCETNGGEESDSETSA